MLANNNGLLNCWSKMYRKSFLTDNHICFPEGWNSAEDIAFSMRCILKADKIYYSSNAYYHYCNNIGIGSLTKKINYNKYHNWRRYRGFIENEIYPQLGINFSPEQNFINIIKTAEREAVNLINENEKYLKAIFNDKDYRIAASSCITDQIESLSEEEKKQCESVSNDDYADWLNSITRIYQSQKNIRWLVRRIRAKLKL